MNTRELSNQWDPALYQGGHSFVWSYGADLLTLLQPRAGMRVLDLGCGTGQLTARIAEAGAEVLGIDSSLEMVETARKNFPELRFEVADARELALPERFDAVFSNAVLHWIPEAEAVVRSIRAALKPGGRLVAEFGGRGNVGRIVDALNAARTDLTGAPPLHFWYFPSVGEYASLLERHRFETEWAALFDRMTPLEGAGGMRRWLEMFGSRFFEGLEPETAEAVARSTEERLRAELCRDGVWHADYRRLRIAARAT